VLLTGETCLGLMLEWRAQGGPSRAFLQLGGRAFAGKWLEFDTYILADESFVCALLDDARSGEVWQRRGRMLLKSRC
jgi:hypothetical protein